MQSVYNKSPHVLAHLLVWGVSLSCVQHLHAQQIVSKTAQADPDFVEELVVAGSRLPTETYKVGRAVTVLDAAQIKNLGFEYASDLFRFIPGVAVNRTGGYGGLTQLRIRGSEANHSVVLIDGIDVSAAGSGEFDVSSLLSADIERIEVLRGPQGGLYGSNALGRVINVVTRRPATGFEMNAELEVGENETRHGALTVSGGSERLRGRVTYLQRRSEFDVSIDDAIIGAEEDEDDNRTFSGVLLIDAADNLSFEISGRHTERDTDIDGFDFSGGPQQGLPIDDNTSTSTEDLTLGVVTTLLLADGRSVSKLSLSRTDTELDGGTFGSQSDRDSVRLDSSWRWHLAGNLQQHTTVFVDGEEESFRNLVPFDPSQVPTQARDLLGYGLEHRIALNDAVFINGSLRRDDNDDFDDSTTYSVDVSYRMRDSGTRLHASYGKAVTNPTFFEQFGFVPGTFVGNAALQPEASKGWDVGIEQSLLDQSLLLGLSYFEAELTDEIQPLFPSVTNVDGESDRTGVEFNAHWQPARNTEIIANYTYTDADEPGGEELRRPAHMASLSVAQGLMGGRLQLAGGLIYNGEMLDTDFRNFFSNGFVSERTELDSYTLVNLNANFMLTDALEVYLRVENLFDEDYQESIGYATPGRTAFAGLRYSFGDN